jgi:dTDP-4-dehydrorhamnose 3,5-epimerase
VRIEETSLPGVVVVQSPVYDDARGFFMEVYHEERFGALGLPTHFAQDSHSKSMRNVLRGLHFQLVNPQGKLVRPTTGTIFDVAVDLRRSSPHYGKWTGVMLTAGDGRQLWIPPGFGHGFLVMSDTADVTYKCTTVYHAVSNRSIRWDDEAIGIEWPLERGVAPILSPKDAEAPLFASDTWYE